jgi:TolB-like protein
MKIPIALYTSIAVGLIAVSAIGIFIYLRLFRAHGDDKTPSIAILPFVDMSPGKDQEYFSDGLADELLTALAKIPELRVSARTSTFQFKEKNEDPRTIGAKLNVSSILEGGVRKDGNRVRITVQLVKVSDGFHLWSESYDRELTDIFTVQADIAHAVAESLKVSLLAEKPINRSTGARDLEAYNAYLQAHYFSERRGRMDMEKAINYYDQSLKLNPNSAQAWAGLADALMHQADSAYIPVEEGYGKARVAVERALALDANSAKAHQCMGWIKMAHDWNWEAANASFQRALLLEPGNATTVWEFGRLAATTGHFEQALELDRKAKELDPLGPTVYLNIGNVAYYMGRYDEAVAALQKALELNHEFPVARAYLIRVYLMQSRAQEALTVANQETEIPWRLYSLALTNTALRRKKEADIALAEFVQKYGNGFAYQVAHVYAYRGDADHSFEWLEKAYAQRDGGITEIKGDPLLKSLEHDPRYANLLQRMNLGN